MTREERDRSSTVNCNWEFLCARAYLFGDAPESVLFWFVVFVHAAAEAVVCVAWLGAAVRRSSVAACVRLAQWQKLHFGPQSSRFFFRWPWS